MFPVESNLEMDFTLESERSGIVNEPIFQLLVLGDWSCDGSKKQLSDRRPIEIDRDNFDDVLNSLGVRLDIDIGGTPASLEFNELDDFHPDQLYKSVPIFSELRDLRRRLRNSDTFNSAAREVKEWMNSPAPEESRTRSRVLEPSAPEAGLLDAILQQPEGGGSPPRPGTSADLSRLIGELVRPHLVTVDENEQSAMIAAVDEATSNLMRSILHERRFQELEAAWRGLFFLVRRTETSPELKIFILNFTKAELAADLKTDSSASAYYKVITSGIGGEQWTAAVGDLSFHADIDDAAALIRLASMSSATRVPFISHIRPDILGISSPWNMSDPADWDVAGSSDGGKLWNAVRSAPGAEFIGLTIPRFLVRLPYGAATDPLESFSFEEFTGIPGHDEYLWANTWFVAAQCLAAAYADFGWSFGQRCIQDVDGLPLYIYKSDGETIYQSCSEVQLSERAAESLAGFGVMPVVSFKGMDRVRLARFQSISDGQERLKGIWS